MKKYVLLFLALPSLVYSQESLFNSQIKEVLSNLIETQLNIPSGDKDWYLEVDGIKLPKKNLVDGLSQLDEKLKISDISKEDKKVLRKQFIQNYIDRMVVLLSTYKVVLESPDLDTLFLDFLSQTSVQQYLEKKFANDPSVSKPTASEVDQAYTQNAKRYTSLGLNPSQVKEYIEMELSQAKMKDWADSEVAKVKAKAKINTNKAVQKELGL